MGFQPTGRKPVHVHDGIRSPLLRSVCPDDPFLFSRHDVVVRGLLSSEPFIDRPFNDDLIPSQIHVSARASQDKQDESNQDKKCSPASRHVERKNRFGVVTAL